MRGMKLDAVLILDVVLVAAAIFSGGAVAEISPALAVPLCLLWPVGLYLDLRSTREIYLLEPEKFSRNELNKILAGLVDRLSFLKGSALYVFMWEIPLFVLFSFFILWFVSPYLPFAFTPVSRAGGAAAGLGVVHLTAWYLNRGYLEARGG